MKLHSSLIEHFVRIYATYGGYKEETRLKHELASLDISVYERSTGEKILVDSRELQKHASQKT